jgi:hypothetical protein
MQGPPRAANANAMTCQKRHPPLLRLLWPTASLAAVWMALAGPAPAQEHPAVLSSGQSVDLTHQLTDGLGYTWDIQGSGNVGRGTDRAYGGGAYLRLNGKNTPGTSRGLLSDDGREIQVGPVSKDGLRIWRRVRVYEDIGLARWLDILHNPGDSKVEVPVSIYSYFNYGVGGITTSSGGSSFGSEDTGFITRPRHTRQNTPQVAHIMCSSRADVRPTLQTSGNTVNVNYRLEIPPGETVILAYFHAQDRDVKRLEKLVGSFRGQQFLRDLPPAVRSLIVSFPASFVHAELFLEREMGMDRVHLARGDIMFGQVANESYRLATAFGEIELDSERLLGMVCRAGGEEAVLAVLTDGQIVQGRLIDQPIRLAIPDGGMLTIPPGRIAQWAYGIAEDRPDEVSFHGPYLVLRDGSRLTFEPDSLPLRFQTRNEPLKLSPNDLLAIQLDGDGHAVHKAVFRNGSVLAGFLEGQTYRPRLALGGSFEVPRNLVRQIELAGREQPSSLHTQVRTVSGDTLFGQLVEPQLTLRTDYGTVDIRRESIEAMALSPTNAGRVAVLMWDGTVLRGRLDHEQLGVRIIPGPTVSLYPAQCESIVRRQVLPPEQIVEQVRQMVLLLGAESYQDRRRATEALKGLGAGVAPLLRQALADAREPEVRMRLETILRHVGKGADPVESISEDELEELLAPQ